MPMNTSILETDYLIIGCGAVGMAFADTILSETNASVLIVDKHTKPGGHWNDAYPFVTLHQPSAFYGVNSKHLGEGKKDKVGLNKGLYELATGAEVSNYFIELMEEEFLPSGRVQYFPECEVKEQGDGFFANSNTHNFVSLKTCEEYQVKVNKKVVDATYFKTSVPSTHTPNFKIDPAVKEAGQFIILNDLPNTELKHAEYVIVGAGKTAMDAVIWMLESGITADKITWIMSRDSWLLDRENTQPAPEFFKHSIGAIADQMEALAKADSIDNLFERLEACGSLLRIDKNVQPKIFHGATISRLELDELRKIKNIVRMGRVKVLQKGNMVFAEGEHAVADNTLFIDCSASAVPPRPNVPVFDNNLITVQTVRTVQPAFSAAFIAHIEATYADEEKKNKICSVVPLPDLYTDWIKVTYTNMINQFVWGKESGIRDWLRQSRLDGFTDMVRQTKPYHLRRMLILKKLRDNARPAMAKAKEFMQELGQL